MKKLLSIHIILLFSSLLTYAQDNTLDSLLFSIKEVIEDDFLENGYSLEKREWPWFGESFELVIVFNKKHEETVDFFNRPYHVITKHMRKSLKSKLYINTFHRYLRDYYVIPFHMFDKIKYRFLLYEKGIDSFEGAVYGEYIFMEDGGQLLIVDKHIELLLNENDILAKYNDNWH